MIRFLARDAEKLSGTKKNIQQLAVLRLVAFTGAIGSLAFLPGISPLLAWGLTIVLLVLFFLGIKSFVKKEKEKAFYTRLIRINQDERLALDDLYEQFDDGAEFTDPNHPYSFDLDLFGPGSLFQYVNRTTTRGGREKLATWLNQQCPVKKIRNCGKKLYRNLQTMSAGGSIFLQKAPGIRNSSSGLWKKWGKKLNSQILHP
jgi:hypothetical protein